MPFEVWFPLLLFAVVGSLTPGPNNVMLAASGVNYGFRRTVPHMIGICLGFPVMFLAVGMGLSGIFEQAPALHTALKFMGSAYLLWLAGASPTPNRSRQPPSMMERTVPSPCSKPQPSSG